jgi:hypothetical protein
LNNFAARTHNPAAIGGRVQCVFFISIFVERSLLLNSGCAIHENGTTNRGGYLDYVLDEHWLKADSKAMRALRAFARFPWRTSKGDFAAKLIGLLALFGPRQFGRRIFD